ncbi:MAG: hypothetical protein EOO73_21070 [Myxococcales bacterium]|nr:MAG: hypothetical protein EOO73_21070 [Myxococcales bacterium]
MSRHRLPIAAALLAPLLAPAAVWGQEANKPAQVTKPAESIEDVKAAPYEPPQERGKSLQSSVGLPPNSLDLGSEADILGVRDSREMAAMLERWSFSMKGSIRAPLRVGFGRRNDGQPGTEMHALPRIVGLGSGDWNYVGLAPNASVTLGIVVANPVVSGTIILGTSHLSDPSYSVIDDVGLDQAYLTFKFPKAFGNRGGISLMTGIFSERFGLSGPYQKSSGYYSTYLFGRTHQAGESLTFDIDLSRKVQLIMENGVGAKTDTVPFFANSGAAPDGPPEADFFPGQQSQPYGSTFVHHTHAALLYDDWFRVSANYLSSWSPDDKTLLTGAHVAPARLNVVGGDVHIDKELFNLYVGYSHVDANNVYPLSDAVNVLHSGTGRSLKLNYFGQKDRFTGITPSNFSGTIDTVLWQGMLRVAPLLGDPFGSRDLNLAVYGMYNKAKSPKEDPNDPTSINIDDDKLKFGVDLDLSLFKFMSVGTRLDRVAPRLADTSDAYTALSPRVSFYTKWKSKEQAIVQYTHFFMGKNTVPGSPYTDEYFHPDPDMLVVMGRMSF